MQGKTIPLAALLLTLAAAAGAKADAPVAYTGREPFAPMDAEAPPQTAVRAGPLAETPWYDLAIHAVGPREGQTVADVGCGFGRISIQLAQTLGDSGRVIARDIDETRLASLRESMERAGLSNVEVAVSRPDDVRIEPGQVDVALLADVYQIVVLDQAKTKAGFLRSLHDALKPGGVVVVVNVATGKRWTEAQQRVHRATVEDFTKHGFVAGRRLVFRNDGHYRAEILEFQRPEQEEGAPGSTARGEGAGDT